MKYLLLSACSMSVPTALHAQSAAAEQLAPTNAIADIVVTAQKREQRLQDVPVAVTALTSDALQANRIVNVAGIGTMVPNLTVSVSPGGSQTPFFVMRGAIGGGGTPGADRGMALYLDGVYLGNTQASIFDLADIERIEVLRGPQGTLFGRNSTAGAISIVTKDPSGELGFRQQFTYGNYDQFRTQSKISLPRFGPFSAALTYTHNQRHGDVRNLAGGSILDFGPTSNGALGRVTVPNRLGDENTEIFSLAVKADISADFKLNYKFDYSQTKLTPTAVGVFYAGDIPTYLGILTSRFPAGTVINQPTAGLGTPVSDQRPEAVNNSFTAPSSTRVYGHNLTAQFRVSDDISLRNILSYRRSRYNAPAGDLSGFGGVAVTVPGSGTWPFILLGSSTAGGEYQWSNELQLNVNTEWFNLTAGLLYYDQNIRKIPIGMGIYTVSGRALINNILPSDSRILPTEISIKSKAVYIQDEQNITSNLVAIIGARISEDVKKGIDNTTVGMTIPFRYHDSRPTYLIGLRYKMSRNQMVYAKFGTGYISGGMIGGLSYTPETSKSYEVGAKLDLLDQRLRINSALFSVTYNSLQQSTSGSTAGVPAGSVVVNVGSARARGIELEVTAQPMRSLTLSGGFSYTDFKFLELSPLARRIGASLEWMRPEVTANASAQYDSPPILGDAFLTARIDANYKSSFASVLSACGLACSTNPTPQQAILGATRVKPAWIVNGRLALRNFNLGIGKAEVAAWARNIFDNRNIGLGTAFGFTYAGTYEKARTFGLDLTFDL